MELLDVAAFVSISSDRRDVNTCSLLDRSDSFCFRISTSEPDAAGGECSLGRIRPVYGFAGNKILGADNINESEPQIESDRLGRNEVKYRHRL
jgi:hypothetical protein